MHSSDIILFLQFRWWYIIDILLVALLLYQLYKLVKGTAALNIFIGIAGFYAFYRIVRMLDMELFSTILGKFIDVGVIAVLIVFQQELRRFFLFIGTTNLLGRGKLTDVLFKWRSDEGDGTLDSNAIVKACRSMSEAKTGAIIVITKSSDLKFYANTGDRVDARVSMRMIESIFFKNSPLHDGAIIITNNVIRAARCVLPVTENSSFPAHLGMRHRAAVGITEVSDALAVIVSEQTGAISVAREGDMEVNITPEKLKDWLDKNSKMAT